VYRDGKLESYLEDAAAKKPAPGGGSVSALAGALAAAMGEMVANFTVGRKKYAHVEGEVRSILDDLSGSRAALLELMDADVEAYGAVDAAYSMPRDSEEERAARKAAIEGALRGAMRVPLDIMRRCADVAGAADRIARIGNANLITDAGVSAILAEAACAAARLNVEVNLKFLDDAELRRSTDAEMDGLTQRVQQCRNSVAAAVAAHLER